MQGESRVKTCFHLCRAAANLRRSHSGQCKYLKKRKTPARGLKSTKHNALSIMNKKLIYRTSHNKKKLKKSPAQSSWKMAANFSHAPKGDDKQDQHRLGFTSHNSNHREAGQRSTILIYYVQRTCTTQRDKSHPQ